MARGGSAAEGRIGRRRAREPPIRPLPTTPLRRRLAALLAGGWRTRLGEGPGAWIFLTVAAVLLRLPRLGESLWYDEVFYSTRERFATWSDLRGSILGSMSAPFYRVVLFGWTELFGEHEIVVRLPSLLAGVGSILLTYELTRRLAGRRAALLAGLWLGFAPVHVWYSQEATPYTMVMFLVAAAAVLAFRLAESERPSAALLALYLVVQLGAVFTHYFAIFVLAPLALVALTARPPARARMLCTQLLVAASFAAMLWAKSSAGALRTGQGFLRPFDAFEAWMLGFHWFLHGNCLWTVSPYRASVAYLTAHPGLVAFQLAAAALLGRGIWLAARGRRRAYGVAMVAFLAVLPVALGALTAIGYRRLYIERYALLALPYFAALLAAGALGSGTWRTGRLVAGALVASACMAYASWYVKDDRWTVYKQNPDWRAAAADIAARAGGRDRALVLFVTPAGDLRFYLRRILGEEAPRLDRARWLRLEVARKHGATTVFLVENRYWREGFEDALAAIEANPLLRRRGLREYKGVRVYEFELQPPAVGRSPEASVGSVPAAVPEG